MKCRSGFFSLFRGNFLAVLMAAVPLALPLAGVLSLVPTIAQAQVVFTSITVSGNQRIEAQSIRSFAAIEPGQPVTAQELNAALRRLNATGLFENVELKPSGRTLEIAVVENPTINRINIEGNNAIEDEALIAALTLRPRRAYSRSQAEADAAIIIEAYAGTGRYNAEVTPVIIRLPDNRVDLVFEVFEGRPTEVQRIAFVGNRAVSDSRLRRVIETGEAGFFSFLFTNDTYDQDRIDFDVQLLREYYLERGYIDFDVRSSAADIARDRSGFFVTFKIFEGEKYDIGKSSVVLLTDQLDPQQFEIIAAQLEPGDVYNVKNIDKTVERLSFEAGRQGFAFVDVRPRVTKNEENLTVDIEFELVEARRIFIERIDIRGNNQTLDRVIRRQFELVEGDPFNAQKLAEAEDNIRALGYFSQVRIRTEQGSAPNLAVIDVVVEEAQTGSLGFGVGYSTSTGASFSVTLSEQNFLGRGQSVSLGFTTGDGDQIYNFGFTEPALFDQDLAVGFNILARDITQDESSFSLASLSLRPRVEFPVSENGRLRLRYRLSSDDIKDIDVDTSPIIRADAGKLTTSSIGFRYTFDKRNSRVDPTRGYLFTLDQDFAGIGGDTEYSKTVVVVSGYKSFLDEDLIVTGELEGGYLASFNNTSRISDRFFLGGDSFLGFAPVGIGPRDTCTACSGAGGDVDDVLGGNAYAVARLEATFPLGFGEDLGMFGGVFFTVGSLWDLDGNTSGASGIIDDSAQLRAAGGVSLFVSTPIGPLRFNFSRPIIKVAGDEEENFRLSIATRF